MSIWSAFAKIGRAASKAGNAIEASWSEEKIDSTRIYDNVGGNYIELALHRRGDQIFMKMSSLNGDSTILFPFERKGAESLLTFLECHKDKLF